MVWRGHLRFALAPESPEVREHAQNAPSGTDCAAQASGNLRITRATWKSDNRQFDNTKSEFQRADLHLEVPAEAVICAMQLIPQLNPDCAKPMQLARKASSTEDK